VKRQKTIERLIKKCVTGVDNIEEYLKILKNISDKYSSTQLSKEAKIFKALSDVIRLKILRALSERDFCVCELEYIIGLSQPTISYHLKILENAGLVRGRTKGRWTFYSIANENVNHLLNEIEKLSHFK